MSRVGSCHLPFVLSGGLLPPFSSSLPPIWLTPQSLPCSKNDLASASLMMPLHSLMDSTLPHTSQLCRRDGLLSSSKCCNKQASSHSFSFLSIHILHSFLFFWPVLEISYPPLSFSERRNIDVHFLYYTIFSRMRWFLSILSIWGMSLSPVLYSLCSKGRGMTSVIDPSLTLTGMFLLVDGVLCLKERVLISTISCVWA